MGGISVLVMLSVMGTLAIVILGVVFVALAMFVAATIVGIVFACRTKTRREQGKKLKGLIAIPLVLYALSIPVLVWFAVVWVIPLAADVEGDQYYEFSQAITRHDPAGLEACFEAHALAFDETGVESLEALLTCAVEYGDVKCAEIVLREAEAAEKSIDLNEPLQLFSMDGEPYNAEYTLIRAAGEGSSSSRMLALLLDAGADPNVSSLLDADGSTALHLVCEGSDIRFWEPDSVEAACAEQERAICVLLAAGADPAALDRRGETPGDSYGALIERLVEEGSLPRERADQLLAANAPVLNVP